MEPLSFSALLFTLVALEVSITIKKSMGEGNFAFLSPRIRSSRQQVLSTKLEEFLKIKDHQSLQTVLSEYGILDQVEKNLSQLERTERSITSEVGPHYNRILHYLTEDLKEFFKAYKTLWDIQNLKGILCSIHDEYHPEGLAIINGPFNQLNIQSAKKISKIKDLDEALQEGMKMLPSELSAIISLEEDYTFQELLFSLDLAGFKYLQKKKEEIETQKVRGTWKIVTGLYEIENIISIGRLKYANLPTKEISHFLFPVRHRLEDSDVDKLLEAEDYPRFLAILRGTSYKKRVPQGEVTPQELELGLRSRSGNQILKEKLQEDEIGTVANFLLNLEKQYDIMREASFFVFLKRR
ncbi:MAG: V-type ATPase subunit [Thermoproteota archaeon]